MLTGSELPTTTENESMFLLYVQLSDQIYGQGRAYEKRGCPFLGEVSTLMDMIGDFKTQHAVINETWLLFLDVCVKHKQCFHCFQEIDDYEARRMIWLRRKVIDAASELISTVYEATIAKDDFIPPFIACSRALISGCCMVINISKQWVPAQIHWKDIIKCTEILTLYAPHWQGGHSYLEVWRIIINQLEIDKGKARITIEGPARLIDHR
jgi:hypothetical protein